jgi:hypothetical protein
VQQVGFIAVLALAACSPAAPAVAPTPVPTIEPAATATVAPTLAATVEPEPPSTESPTETAVPSGTATVAASATKPEAGAATEAPANLPFPTGKFLHANQGQSNEEAYFLFGADGRWSHHAGSMTLATGEYRIEGDLYIQTKNSHGCDVPMSFRYTFDGTHLHFYLTEESQNDTCDVRLDRYDDKIYILAD